MQPEEALQTQGEKQKTEILDTYVIKNSQRLASKWLRTQIVLLTERPHNRFVIRFTTTGVSTMCLPNAHDYATITTDTSISSDVFDSGVRRVPTPTVWCRKFAGPGTWLNVVIGCYSVMFVPLAN